MARVQTILLVVVLLGAGVLLGSFFLEWRGHSLVTPDEAGAVRGLPSTAGSQAHETQIAVEVLNGAGDRGAAHLITDALRAAGFDVKTFGNAADFDHEHTVVIDRSGRRGAARAVAETLGVSEIQSELRPDLYLDATIILGRDWRDRLEQMSSGD
jgi:hypothetical protein